MIARITSYVGGEIVIGQAFRRSVTIGLVALFASLVPLAASAAPAQSVEHVHFDEDSTTSLCGPEMPVHYSGVQNYFYSVNSLGVEMDKVTGSLTGTITYNGNTVVDKFAGRATDVSAVSNSDGSTTVTTTFTGNSYFVRDGNNYILLHDRGRLVFVTVFDSGGNFISSSTQFEAGQHPNYDSNGQLYIDTVCGALLG